MNKRRQYFVLASVIISLLAAAKTSHAQLLNEKDVISGADARIAKYRTGDAKLKLLDASGKPIARGRQVTIEQARHKFLFGSNIFWLGKAKTPEQNQEYADRFAAILNYATLPFYWWTYEPAQGKPSWSDTEKVAAWCRAHGIKMKGHPLAWNFFDPRWLPDDPDEAMKLQLARVTRDVAQFKGAINFWDAVNEATHYDREDCKKNSPNLTAAITKTGMNEYVHAAFAAARAANPDATLVINDYETGPEFADKIVSKLVDENGKPLYNVIGIQSHQHRGAWPVKKIWDVCELYAKFGKPIHFTETTFLSGEEGWELKRGNPDFKWDSTPDGEARQAREAARFYTILFSHPAVEAITWWDFSDQGAWQRAPAGLLRADMTPKPVYDALYHLIKEQWWTRVETKAAGKGAAEFHGFFGDYRVTVTDQGRTLTGQFTFDKPARSPIEVKLNP